MSKPSPELLRRAGEFALKMPQMELKPTTRSADFEVTVSPYLAQFAEQIVRECAEAITIRRNAYAEDGQAIVAHECDQCIKLILRKFGLKE